MSTAASPAAKSSREADDAADVAAAAAAAEAAAVTFVAASKNANPELDTTHLANLPTEQQEVTLLQFSARLSKHVNGLTADDCTAQQVYLKKEMFKILLLTTPYPSRVVRNTLGRCLATVLSKGDRKLLFETINDLLSVVTSSGKIKADGSGETRTKQAAVVCLGEVFGAAGDSAISLHHVTCSALLKVLKAAQSHAGMRAAVFTALAKLLTCIGASCDEGLARDVWKQARNHASGDKGALVSMAACRCLTVLVRHTGLFDTTSDYESLCKTVFKTMDAASSHVRRAAADSLVEMLVQGYAAAVSGAVAARPGRSKLTRTKSLKRASTLPTSLQDDIDELPGSRASSPGPGSLSGTGAGAGGRSNVLALSLGEVLRVLSTHYVRATTTNRARVALGVCYGRMLQRLGEKTVEQSYMLIVDNLTVEVLGHAHIANHRYRLLMARRIVDTIMQEVVGRDMLSEAGQVAAAKALVNGVLRNYPQVLKEQPEPSKHTLVAALGALASLLEGLGSAANSVAEACREGLLQLLAHPAYSVQVHAAGCLKSFVLACPTQLLPCLTVCMNSLARELGQLTGGAGGSAQQHRRCVGFAHGLAATLSASPQRPLYGSVDVNARVLTMATGLLKTSGQSELRVASVQIQVAYVLLGGLMALGPNFVKIHLGQMLLLWKNALPRPLARDKVATRTALETSFLAQIRECALGSILAFLQFNGRLLTVDVSKRIAAMLQHTAAFLKTLPAATARRTPEEMGQRLAPALPLAVLEVMVQRRLLQCYLRLVNLVPAGGSEALLQANLLTLVISQFADPEYGGEAGGSLSATIATAAGAFETIWEVGDNAGFGVTGLVTGFRVRRLPGQHDKFAEAEEAEQQVLGAPDWTSGPEGEMESVLLSPVCGALEHDASVLYVGSGLARTDPAATEVVNLAIQLFAFVFPVTVAKVQESVLEQLATFMTAGSLQRDAGRKAAIQVNVAAALLLTLKVAVRETAAAAGAVTSAAVERLLEELVRGFVTDGDAYVRSLGYGALGRLCSACGAAFTSGEVKQLVDTIVVNREPSARAGCAMALGSIQTRVGGLAGSYHLKTVLGILMSLCNDPHPTVHFWALEAFGRASEAAGLPFASYVASTVGMLAALYGSADHDGEGPSAASQNLEVAQSTPAAIARCVDTLINVLGPDLQEATRARDLIVALVAQFGAEAEDAQVQRASLDCLEHLSLYAPGLVAEAAYVQQLQAQLGAADSALRDAAVDGLFNLMKRRGGDAVVVAAPGLEGQLWLALDRQPRHEGLRTLLASWLRQTGLAATDAWLQRFQRVLKMTRAKVPATVRAATATVRTVTIDLQDEEVAGLGSGGGGGGDGDGDGEGDGAGAGGGGDAGGGGAAGEGDAAAAVALSDVEPLRWQVSAFVLGLLDELFQLAAQEAAAASGSSSGTVTTRAQAALQGRIAEVVRMAFSASTAGVLEQRVWGLKLIGAVLRMFGRTVDPDFDEAMLLEQYQAQISSALTPAFAADSSPELAAEAVQVCAAFVATGIVTDVDRMGRILKTLVGALESFAGSEESGGGGGGSGGGSEPTTARIGDLHGLSANAQVMVKMSVFAAWAELQVASLEQQYLVAVLQPHLARLTPLWLESLRAFARLRFEPDISMTLGPPALTGSLDTIYAALNRETLLAFYQDAWLQLVDAIASLIEQDSGAVFDALEGGVPGGGGSGGGGGDAGGGDGGDAVVAANGRAPPSDINYRDEPVAFFFVLFGLAFEALAARPDPRAAPGQTLAILRALKKILHPSVSGQAIYRDAVFSETMDLLDRLALTEGLDVQGVIVDMARALCLAHPAARAHNRPDAGELTDDIEQLFELTRIMVLVLSGLLPGLAATTTTTTTTTGSGHHAATRYTMTEEPVLQLVRTALAALVDAAEVFPAVIRTDLHACLVHIFATVLATPACQAAVVPQALPTLKRFIATAAQTDGADAAAQVQTQTQMRACLRRLLSVYLHAQRREEPTALACVKNCLLALTILFTAAPNVHLPAADPLVAKFLDELLDCLTDRMTSTIAANCCRSLLLHGRTTAADHSIGRYLLPRLLAFVADTTAADPEHARPLVAHALTAFVAALAKQESPPGGVAVAMALVIPALLAGDEGVADADDADDETTTAIYRATSDRLLELASADPAAFRAVVAGLAPNQRAFLEAVIAAGRQPETTVAAAPRGQPTITLKDFGS